jgi:signal transduction histidine kinase
VLDGQRAIELLVRFTRMAAAAQTPDAILALLAEVAVRELGCDGTAVLRIDDSGRLVIAAGQALTPGMLDWKGEPEGIAGEAGQELLGASAGRFQRAIALPLVSGSDLYGALIVFDKDGGQHDPAERVILDALCDVAATSLDKGSQLDSLRRSYDELRASREILARGEKLRALGQVSAGISHDLKNLLNPLALQIQLIERRLHKDPGTIPPVLENMRSTLAHGLGVVERLRDFSRQSPEKSVEPVSFDDVAKQAIEIARPKWQAVEGRVRIDMELGSPPPVVVSSAELVSAVVNLVVNAVDAMHAVGTRIVISTGQSDGGAFIAVRDDGPGMSPEVQARLFEPFFTTKGSEGTGLGLAMVYALVQRHGGRIEAVSAPGAGATFKLWFPIAAGKRRV